VIVVSDSSPLIALAKIDSFSLLPKVYGELYIPSEVYDEVVIAGAGLPGAIETSDSPWIHVRRIKNAVDLAASQARFGLGVGELSTMILAKELHADLVILDDLRARKLAQSEGFRVQGCIAILEASFRKGHLPDLRQAYDQMAPRGARLRDLHRRRHACSPWNCSGKRRFPWVGLLNLPDSAGVVYRLCRGARGISASLPHR
jgi:predicted nucleic acid-binding protein